MQDRYRRIDKILLRRTAGPYIGVKLDRVGRDRKSMHFRFSNRPFGVKHFQTIHRCSVDVAHGLALLFGIGTKALP